MATSALATYSRPRHRSPQPIVVRPRVVAPKAKKHHRRGHSVAGGGLKTLAIFGAAGFVMGQIDKSGTNIPTVPILGRAGTIAVILHFIGKRNPMLQQAALAAASVAGYEYGNTGKVSGVHGMVARQT